MTDYKRTVQVLIEVLARHLVYEQAARAGLMPLDTDRVKHALLRRGICLIEPLIKVSLKGIK
jgi:hypothetical protein